MLGEWRWASSVLSLPLSHQMMLRDLILFSIVPQFVKWGLWHFLFSFTGIAIEKWTLCFGYLLGDISWVWLFRVHDWIKLRSFYISSLGWLWQWGPGGGGGTSWGSRGSWWWWWGNGSDSAPRACGQTVLVQNPFMSLRRALQKAHGE